MEMFLTKVINDLKTNSDSPSVSVLDLSASFNSVDGNILIQSLYDSVGLSGQILIKPKV